MSFLESKAKLPILLTLITLIVGVTIYWLAPKADLDLDLDDPSLIPITETVKLSTTQSKDPPDEDEDIEIPPDDSEITSNIKIREHVITSFKRFYPKKSRISQENWQMALDYLNDMDKVYTSTFVSHRIPQIGKIASYGIIFLSEYATNNQKIGFLTVVEDLIARIDDALKTTELGRQKTPWGQKWYDISVLLTRMLATYEFLGTNDDTKDICHRRIREITPKWNESLGWKREGIELVWIAIPWLIDVSIYDHDLYSREFQLESFEPLDAFFLGTCYQDFEKPDGIYEDGSYVYNKVATYWPLAESGQFYSSVAKALGFNTGIEKITMKIFDKILHLSMDFIPMGLFGCKPVISRTKILQVHWPNYQQRPDLKVHIFPFIGLGVFKSNKFAFWVRVQRSYLVAYESDKTYFEFAAGWIQMRKLYLVDVDYKYEGEMTWAQLKHQPGVISFADRDNFDSLKPEQEEAQHFPGDVDSHIGHFDNENGRVLYWRNKYKFKLYGDTEINEFGVCTDNGLVMRLEVKNLTGKVLMVRVKDDDNSKMFFHYHNSNSKYSDGFVTIDKDSKAVINWRQVFDVNIKPQEVTLDATGQHMAFKFGRDDYVIESGDYYHIVKKNSLPILAGRSKIFSRYPILYKYGSLIYQFGYDTKTLMYTRQH